ncbi:putative nucleoside-diphosphate-sugar epimerase [Aspergillus lucknowensis]|uniref:Nucleoside-diphosphate-sugar epimerase n=1 Tax=Aspergillus lucknowensis TaxID=176173 RepID=A0ABR4M4Z7_9EURO
MKVIIAGATGYIGQELLAQCLAHPSITSIVALSRRDVGIVNPKLRVCLMKDADYLSYADPAVAEELKGAGACLWALGLRPSQALDEQHTRRVCVDYTAAAAAAFQRAHTTEGSPTGPSVVPFRFVYVSGALAERDQSRSLWFAGGMRRLRGETENVLLRHAEANPGLFEAFIMQPGLVPSKEGTLRDRLWSLVPSVRKDYLAKAMIEIALRGNAETTVSNLAINEMGRVG